MKVNFSEGSYLKAADIPQPVVATIQAANMETIQQGEPTKVVVSFAELTKPLVLNKTNGNIIVQLYSDDTESWLGRPVEVYATTTSFQGRQVACIRVRQPQQPVAQAAPTQQPAVPVTPPPAAPVQQPVAQQYQAPVPPQPPIQAPTGDTVPFDA